jgi:hypothetical protein
MGLLEVLGGAITLAIAILAWVRSANDRKVKEKADEDAKIDASTGADALLRRLDELRNK